MVILRIKSPFLFMQVALREWSCGFKDNTKFVINAGPYLAFGLGGKAKDDNFDLKLFKSDEGDWKRFDLGIQYGIGLELSDRYLINLTGQNGFISPVDGGDDPKNMTFTIGVGYRF